MKIKLKYYKVTVLMPVYNGEKYLKEAIDSILGQTLRDFELLIIDDASTDNTRKILKSYKDPRTKIIVNKKNLGLTRSLNKGLKIAKGEYIARQDADDISVPERLEKEYQYLLNNPAIFLVGSGVCKIDEKGNVKAREEPLVGFDLIKKTLPTNNCFYHSSIMFRNEKNNFYRGKFLYAQDYDFYLTLLSKSKQLNNINEPLIKFRIIPGATSWSNKTKQRLFGRMARKFYQQRLKLGKDGYDLFNPEEILSIEVERSNNRGVLEAGIEASCELGDFKKVRKLGKRYLWHYGPNKKIMIQCLRSVYSNLFK